MTATEIVIVIAGTVVGWSLLNLGVMALMIWASNPDPHLGEAADAASREAEKLRIEIEEQPNPKVVWLPRATDRARLRLITRTSPELARHKTVNLGGAHLHPIGPTPGWPPLAPRSTPAETAAFG
jgi:hypothetical protein